MAEFVCPTLPPPISLLIPAWNLLIGLLQSLSHSILIGHLPQASPLTNLHKPSSKFTLALKMETACFSEILASINQSTWCWNPKQHHHNHHSHENLKSHNFCVSFDLPKCTENDGNILNVSKVTNHMSMFMIKTYAAVIRMDTFFSATTEKITLSVKKNQSDAICSDYRGSVHCVPHMVRLLTFKYKI
jgi:hypothetical protein